MFATRRTCGDSDTYNYLKSKAVNWWRLRGSVDVAPVYHVAGHLVAQYV